MKLFNYLSIVLLLLTAQLVSAGIIGQWSLDDVSGTTTVATVGTDGSYENVDAADLAQLGSPGDFDSPSRSVAINGNTGAGQIRLGDVSTPDPLDGLSQASISMWVNFTNTSSDSAILSNDTFGSSADLLFFRDNDASGTPDTATLIVGGQRLVSNASALNQASQWYHVVFTFDGTSVAEDGTIEIFVNGSSVGSLASSSLPSNLGSSGILTAGQSSVNGNRQFNGLIDEISIYDHVLSGPEIQALYQPVAQSVVVSASTPVTSTTEGDFDAPANITLTRTGSTLGALNINLTLSGTATAGEDYVAIDSNNTFLTGEVTRTFLIDSPIDESAEGTETLTLTIAPGSGYTLGATTQATIDILDSEFDIWRAAQFNTSQLADINISGADADPDSDEHLNYEEFLANTNPLAVDAGIVLEANTSPTNHHLNLEVSPSASSEDFQFEASLDINSWQEIVGISPTETPLSGKQDLEYTLPSTTPQKQFWRASTEPIRHAAQASDQHAFWSFDSMADGTGSGTSAVSFSQGFASPPLLSATGSAQSILLGGAETLAPDGQHWMGEKSSLGHSLSWEEGSTENAFQINFTAQLQSNIQVRMQVCADGLSQPTEFASLTYDTGFGPASVPDAALEITTNGQFEEWAVDLSGLTAIEGRSNVTLRWELADLSSGQSIQIDNIALSSEGRSKSQLVRNLEAGRQQTIVRLGTSITNTGSWGPTLIETLDANYGALGTMINSGASGKYSNHGVANINSLVLQHAPDTLFIEYSINDSVERFELSVASARSNLEFIIDTTLASYPDCEIILMTMTPGHGPPVGDFSYRLNIADHYQMYRDVSTARGFLLIDHFSTWSALLANDGPTFNSYVGDTIHPNESGNDAVVSPVIHNALGIGIDL